jgi:phytoene synthase
MNDLYTRTCIECSALITKRYSTSFSLGILMLDKSIRNDIYSIYGFVRLADEIVDTYLDKDPISQLQKLKADTFDAIENGISFNPVLHAFQDTVNNFGIDKAYIEAFLYSMELDLNDQKYDQNLYEKYIYGSAEVVGLMCLKVFCQGNDAEFQTLVEPARKLGSAFQKVNFLRDIKSDLEDRNRIYFPGLDINNFSTEAKKRIEKEIADEFMLAQLGISRLPQNSRKGVQLALDYYKGLLKKITASPPEELLERRIRITNLHKIRLFIANLVSPTYLKFQNA